MIVRKAISSLRKWVASKQFLLEQFQLKGSDVGKALGDC